MMHHHWWSVVKPLLEASTPGAVVQIGAQDPELTHDLTDHCRRHGGVLHVVEPEPPFDVDDWQRRFGRCLVVHAHTEPDPLIAIRDIALAVVDRTVDEAGVHRSLRSLLEGCVDSETTPPLVLVEGRNGGVTSNGGSNGGSYGREIPWHDSGFVVLAPEARLAAAPELEAFIAKLPSASPVTKPAPLAGPETAGPEPAGADVAAPEAAAPEPEPQAQRSDRWVEALEDEVERLRAGARAAGDVRERSQETIRRLSEELDRARADLVDQVTEREIAKRLARDLEEAVDGRIEQARDEEQTTAGAELRRMADEFGRLHRTLQATRDERDESTAELAESKRHVARLTKRSADAEAGAKQARGRADRRARERDASLEKVSSLQSQLEHARATIDSGRTELKRSQEKLEKQVSRVTELEAQRELAIDDVRRAAASQSWRFGHRLARLLAVLTFRRPGRTDALDRALDRLDARDPVEDA